MKKLLLVVALMIFPVSEVFASHGIGFRSSGRQGFRQGNRQSFRVQAFHAPQQFRFQQRVFISHPHQQQFFIPDSHQQQFFIPQQNFRSFQFFSH